MQIRSNNGYAGCCIISILVLFVLASLTLPIVILVYAGVFRNEMTCRSVSPPSSYVPLPPNLTLSSPSLFTLAPNLTLSSPSLFTPVSAPVTDQGLATTIGIATWMIIHGSIGIYEVANVILYLTSAIFVEENSCQCIFFTSMWFIGLFSSFRIAWLIVGAVMFWRDCPNLSPSSVNELMWATLIIGFIGLFTILFTSNARKPRE
jgi:hypothetical protein